ncbi:MAG: SPOR domain-containing protein [Thermodesulfovibrionales bacterium]|nr:SPOR domain-containing protein [Thermodesulfovibrionales bacterium]
MAEQSILIIDIKTELIQKISAVLEPEGYSLFSANSGEAGVDLAKKVRPALIFVNAGISEGMRGLEICKTIHEAEELMHIPLVILTPRNVIITERDRELYGIVDYVTYFFNSEDLRRKTEDLISFRKTGEEPQSTNIPADEQKEEQIAETGNDDHIENKELNAEPDMPEPESIDIHRPEQTSDGFTEAVPPAVEEKKEWEEGETENEPGGEADLLIPSLAEEEDTSASKKKKLQKWVFFLSLVIILIVIVAGGIIFYEDISPRSFFQKSQPEIIPPSFPDEQQTVNIVPPDESLKRQGEEEKTAPPPENTIPPQAIEENKPPPSREKQSAQATGREKPKPSPLQDYEVKPGQKVVYAVQIGVFTQETNAASLVRQYKDKGYSTWLYKGTASKGASLYRVLIGKFEHEKDAKKHAETIHARENIPVVLFKE